LPCFFESVWTEGLDVKALAAQGSDGIANCLTGLGGYGNQAVVFKEADGDSLEVFEGMVLERDWRADGVGFGLSGEDAEEE
jgi:hypothetical protein